MDGRDKPGQDGIEGGASSASFRRGRRLAVPFFLVGALLPAAAQADPVEARVEALVRKMTLEEKVGQLNLAPNVPSFDYEKVRAGRVGAVINFNNARDISRAQEAAQASRLQIPLLVGYDILHGFRTMFPVPLAETATFNPALARTAAEWSAREATHLGIRWTYGPMADLARDPRWGRIVEGSGEDPLLGRIFTRARVEGFRAGGVATAVKHFAGYGAAQGGRDYDSTDIPPAQFRDLYLPPFRGALEAGSETVMAAFNAIDGVPATANRWLLTDILRGELGFKGFVVSDWDSVGELVAHGVAADGAEAARKAFLAGVDMDLAGGEYDRHLAGEVRAGRVPEAALDEAVRRVLRVKVRLGLFEQPPVDPTNVDAIFPTPGSRAAARAVAREAVVLLENKGTTLPIRPEVRRVALIGGLAASAKDQLGPHEARGHREDTVTIRDGLQTRAVAAGAEVVYVPGCDPACASADGFAAAVETARGSDLVVAVLGEPEAQSGEAASKTSLGLPGRQRELLEQLLATGRPVVLVLVAGRPLDISDLRDRLAAVMMAWFLGNEGGPALAEILFGDIAPSGRLPLSWPRSVGQIPVVYNRLPTGRPPRLTNRFTLGYRDERLEPLYPFGFGLGYTQFGLRDIAVETPVVGPSDRVRVRVTVANEGERAGQAVPQLYVRDPVASRSRPLRELKAFTKLALGPGEAQTVALEVPAAELGFHREDGSYVVEAGRFDLFLGTDATAPLIGSVELTQGFERPPGSALTTR